MLGVTPHQSALSLEQPNSKLPAETGRGGYNLGAWVGDMNLSHVYTSASAPRISSGVPACRLLSMSAFPRSVVVAKVGIWMYSYMRQD
jgi:hypothetical protein